MQHATDNFFHFNVFFLWSIGARKKFNYCRSLILFDFAAYLLELIINNYQLPSQTVLLETTEEENAAMFLLTLLGVLFTSSLIAVVMRAVGGFYFYFLTSQLALLLFY